MCLEVYEFHPARFLTARQLAWQAVLKNIKIELLLLNDVLIIDILICC